MTPCKKWFILRQIIEPQDRKKDGKNSKKVFFFSMQVQALSGNIPAILFLFLLNGLFIEFTVPVPAISYQTLTAYMSRNA